ncbi:MAG: NADH-quinone oxidoreductase subunit L [Deltaproteobacteria bacterium]|nr:NADH-quinone oxidoreductase subunit L [Deltaproteobacteria bacterium]
MHAAALFHPTSLPYLWLIPALPFLGALINGTVGLKLMRRFGPKVNHTIAILLPTISFVLSVLAFAKLLTLEPEARAIRQSLFPFLHVGFMDADMAFWVDPLSATMLLIITFIGTLIHVYSVGYMAGDDGYWRFFAYLNLFMGSMLMLVLGDNFLVMFIGWEGVGLCSYLLIAFWYKEKANAVAGMKAFVVNRVGDFGFVLGLALLFWGLQGSYSGTLGLSDGYRAGLYAAEPITRWENAELGRQAVVGFVEPRQVPPTSLRFDLVKSRVEAEHEAWAERSPAAKTFMGIPLIVLVCLLFFVGATGKSAQIPLYVWLPDAMAGPTPVSALIHAATMVTAGVYMVARLGFLFALSPTAMTVVALTGVITALFAASIGLFQHDIKKVLAYSTVSQLGYMFVGVGVGAYWAGIYHLLNHAVFKACLFLGSGSVILGCHHEQDMRKMGGLKKYMPVTRWTYWMACVAITTAPLFFLSNGFFSKDEILWKAFDAQHLLVPGWVVWLIGFIGAAFTSFYMWRSYYMTFTGLYRGGAAHGHDAHAQDAHAHDAHADHKAHDDHHAAAGHATTPHESPRSMTFVLATLAALIIVTIGLGFWPLLGIVPLFEHWLAPVVGEATESLTWMSAAHGVFLGLQAHTWEMLLAAGSVLLALGSFFVARALYKDAQSPIPARLMASTHPVVRFTHRLIYNKYFVDEAYDFLFVRRARALAGLFFAIDQKVIDGVVNLLALCGRLVSTLDGAIDALVVDGVVNGVANGFAGMGRRVRLAQTGQIQTYLAGAIVGVLVLVLINYFLFL